MAGETTTVAGAASDAEAIFMPVGRQMACVTKKFEITTGELELADVIQVIRLPKGALVVDGYLKTDDLDAHACPLLQVEVGTGDDTNGLLAANTLGQAGGVARFDGALLEDGVKLTVEDTIDIKISAAAATAQAGTVALCVMYVNGDDDV